MSALLETYLVPASNGTFIGVGLIEELTKALILVAVVSRLPTIRPGRDGLRRSVGAGFAAFESAGYALNTLLQN